MTKCIVPTCLGPKSVRLAADNIGCGRCHTCEDTLTPNETKTACVYKRFKEQKGKCVRESDTDHDPKLKIPHGEKSVEDCYR